MKTSPLAVLFAAVLVDMVGFGIVLPLLPFYAESMGATPLEVTLLIASFSAMQLVAAPLWGRLSDRRGRRPLIVAGLFASAISYLIFGLADSLALLLVSRMAAGAAGGTISVAQAYVADSTAAEDRARGLGLLGAAAGLGVMLGPAIGGFFSQWGLGAPGFVAAALCAANAVAAVLLLTESRPSAARASSGDVGQAATLRGWLRAMTRFPLWLLLCVYFLSISSFTAMTSVLALYAERAFGLDARGMGIVFTLAGGMSVVVRGVLLGPLVRRLGEPRTARLGALALACAILLVALIPNAWWLGATVALHALGAGTLFPTLASLVSRATDAHSQGSVLGGSQVVGGLGRVLGPIWAGILFQRLGIATPFEVGGALVVFAWLLAWRIPAPARACPAQATDSAASPDPAVQ
ncbi:MAG TPA: MFS transporter [Longimicrobiales bacterium]